MAHPASSEPVPLIDLAAQYAPIADEVMETVTEVFSSQRFVLGDEVTALEEEIATYVDARYAIGCASGTDALILALMALDIGPGDEVITSPFTFFATASSIHRVGAKPVFVDIKPETFNLDPEKIEAAITPNTKAIMPVHIFGQCAEMDPLWRIAVKHGLQIVEDAAQAIGAKYRGRSAGVLGTIGCFSFFPTKNLGGAGDGGMITTDDKELAKRMMRLRVHGDVGGYEHVEVGLNSRLDALQAAVLRIKLRHLESWSTARRTNSEKYRELFDQYGLDGYFDRPEIYADRKHVFNQYTVRVPNGHRDAVVQYLRDRQVGCGIYYPKALHLQTCFEYLGYKSGDFPEAEKACLEVMSLPIFSELTDSQLETVAQTLCDAAAEAINGGQELRKAA
ncbi:MAG: DegT/DnrJ/EryC1/StrS family aminotransferase [Planctomycetaceae bacterium]|jgi:dTDP-4-amino-4,6-dideoxygalactose transaminase|nr:DegT/DnrJ/EryC1/StrS family aminotransferase [bacterium]MDG2388361.1 DegT/DnrJ/EryC1/StrS family aminotransferase [Planctomycetaceae bacterium]